MISTDKILLIVMLALTACSPEKEVPQPPRLVSAMIISPQNLALTIEASGQIAARNSIDIGFQLDGRLIEKLVNTGDKVVIGQLMARLDSSDEQSQLASANAQLEAMTAALVQTSQQEQRSSKLLKDGFATKENYDADLRAMQTSAANVKNAQAQLALAQNHLDYTNLSATSTGIVTDTGPDPGQVVNAGQMIVQIAGLDQRDAIFAATVEQASHSQIGTGVDIWLDSEKAITTHGTIRQIAPSADPITRTYTIKVGLPDNAPPELRLGAAIIGRVKIDDGLGIIIPSTALLQTGAVTMLWLVDPLNNTVQQKPVKVLRYDSDDIHIEIGDLKNGDIIITQGVNSLSAGQKVTLPAKMINSSATTNIVSP